MPFTKLSQVVSSLSLKKIKSRAFICFRESSAASTSCGGKKRGRGWKAFIDLKPFKKSSSSISNNKQINRRLRFRGKSFDEIHIIPSRYEYNVEDIKDMWWRREDYDYFRDYYIRTNEDNEPLMTIPRSPIPRISIRRVNSDDFNGKCSMFQNNLPVYYYKGEKGIEQFQIMPNSTIQYHDQCATESTASDGVPHRRNVYRVDSMFEDCSDSSSNSSELDSISMGDDDWSDFETDEELFCSKSSSRTQFISPVTSQGSLL
mmetsp:Transcript_16021/g.23774  ORF Transcript_16021/g.23774 Transcript_16021/m.23774 type:complete len:260 (+) Transcript_16021:218-997(+)|eukprot:CAMPEP_0171465364 /NCGR_PEP_ID=MMETSP0945-20130129/8449_1 /TAXON_ID=109269 /ORGANISM="Vaucheria litorea, Strain CCMP2940" /LENGTH=259 /DNA_ID=CAMNT_0011992911 /DNA_START=124 /DNA_END=903 /DNA_ORIENTATION=+